LGDIPYIQGKRTRLNIFYEIPQLSIFLIKSFSTKMAQMPAVFFPNLEET
jgi:hypothetical protein